MTEPSVTLAKDLISYTCPLMKARCLGKGDCRLWVELDVADANGKDVKVEGCAFALIAKVLTISMYDNMEV